LVFSSVFFALAAGPLDPVLDFGAGFAATGFATFLALVFVGLATLLAADLATTFDFGVFGVALAGTEAFLLFGSAFEEAFGEAFFGATVAFASLTSRYCLDFGNY